VVAHATVESASGWRTFPCTLDTGPAPVAAIGLVALATDMASEPEMSAFLPGHGIGLYTTRIPMAPVVTPESLRAMEQHLASSIGLLLPGQDPAVVAFGCTSGSIAIGPSRVRDLIRSVKPGSEVTNPITAGAKALRHLRARRIAVLTPYADTVNEEVERHFSEVEGFELVAKGSFKQPGDWQMNRVSPRDIYEAGMVLGREQVDALFISCTGLRTSPILEDLERALGKPVVASNQAQAWDCLRLAGYHAPVEGYGSLLRS
jgi:maleate isomerase